MKTKNNLLTFDKLAPLFATFASPVIKIMKKHSSFEPAKAALSPEGPSSESIEILERPGTLEKSTNPSPPEDQWFPVTDSPEGSDEGFDGKERKKPKGNGGKHEKEHEDRDENKDKPVPSKPT
ncbi:MAG: hypothetical protein LBF41_03415, partial [Deltaproteobacteria bacterium]|nr:hypothetical protein [Deltaproteobacteria bacterium]